MRENSDHYVGFIQQCLTEHFKATGKPGMIMVSFDTELFGHWWFEGIAWIKEVIRKLHTYTAVTMETAGEYLEDHPPVRAIELPESSWGNGGHWQVWLNDDTQWMWPIIGDAEQTMQVLAGKYKHTNGDGLVSRALKQASRELLLLESSDWPFLITTGQAKDYAIERFNAHHARFLELVNMISSGQMKESRIQEIEAIDNCFPELSSTLFAPRATTFQMADR